VNGIINRILLEFGAARGSRLLRAAPRATRLPIPGGRRGHSHASAPTGQQPVADRLHRQEVAFERNGSVAKMEACCRLIGRRQYLSTVDQRVAGLLSPVGQRLPEMLERLAMLRLLRQVFQLEGIVLDVRASPRIQRRSRPKNNRNVTSRILTNQPDDAKWMTCSAKRSSATGTI